MGTSAIQLSLAGMLSPRITSLVAASLLTVAAGSADAGPGLRIGGSSGPDSIFAGLQWRIPLATQVGPGKLLIQPGADIGLVEGPVDLFIRGTLHLGYLIPLNRDIALYPLVGPELIWAKAGDVSDTDVGLDVGVGLQFRKFALELWVGAVDSFDAQLAISFNL